MKGWRDQAGVDLVAPADARVAELLPLLEALAHSSLEVGLCAEVGADGSCVRRAAEVAPGSAARDGMPLLELHEDGRALYGGETLGTCPGTSAADCASLAKALQARAGSAEVVPVGVAPAVSWAACVEAVSTVPAGAKLVFVANKPAEPRPHKATGGQ